MEADFTGLVDSFAVADRRFDVYQALVEGGEEALPALRRGLKSDNWQIRRWSAICLDRVADADALADLVPLLEDPNAKVRLWAIHSLACDHCKDDVVRPVDIVPLLIERAERDENLRVRRMAVIMLGYELLDDRAIPTLERIVDRETDRKLRLHAAEGLRRIRDHGSRESGAAS